MEEDSDFEIAYKELAHILAKDIDLQILNTLKQKNKSRTIIFDFVESISSNLLDNGISPFLLREQLHDFIELLDISEKNYIEEIKYNIYSKRKLPKDNYFTAIFKIKDMSDSFISIPFDQIQ